MARRRTAAPAPTSNRPDHDIPVRRWTVLAQDPSFLDDRGRALTTMVEVPAERLETGPKGHRVHVMDYDASTHRYYGSREKDLSVDHYCDPKGMAMGALVRDPYFHQQNVYALVAGTLYQFERALGRPVDWGFAAPSHQIKVAPHAFADANAYYSRESESLNFGYFPDPDTGKRVYTCLSHDIIVHETTHAILDGLRPHYLNPSSADQAGFHEGFADVVALLSVFRHAKAVDHALRQLASKSGRLRAAGLSLGTLGNTPLSKLAEEMGAVLDGKRGSALRHSVNIGRDRRHYAGDRFSEEHDRGELLVAIMIRSFLIIWHRRLDRLLNNGRGSLARSVVAEEGSDAALHLLQISIRALDYMPPVDLSYPDFLSAMLTADRELFPDDRKYHYRDVLRDEFAAQGIVPATGVKGDGCWDPPPTENFSLTGMHLERLRRDPTVAFRFVWENRDALRIFPDAFTRVTSVRPVARVSRDGTILLETVAEYVQTLKVYSTELKSLGIEKPKGMRRSRLITLYGGGTLIFGEYGQVKYHVGTGVARPSQSARLKYLWEQGYFDETPSAAARIAQMHQHRELRPVREIREDW